MRFRSNLAEGPRSSVVYFLSFCLFFLATPFPVHAETVLGPQAFERGRGKPQAQTTFFSVPWPEADYLLNVYNGGRDDVASGARVSTGEIQLNGLTLVGPQHFSQNLDVVGVPVRLKSENELVVLLGGKPGGLIVVEITLAGNVAPIADAGEDQTAHIADTVILDGSGSTDVNGDLLSYAWALVERPVDGVAVLTNADTLGPSFVVDANGEYVIELVVNDGELYSAADRVLVTTENAPPVANAGEDQFLLVGDIAYLDGSSSYDADGDQLTYDWRLSAVPHGSLTELHGADGETPSFVVDLPGQYLALLEVSDGTHFGGPDEVYVTTQNSRPVADAGGDRAVYVGDSVIIDGSASYDADGDTLEYLWALLAVPEGGQAELTPIDEAIVALSPEVVGEYVVQLIVRDGVLDSIPDTARVTASGPNLPPVITSLPLIQARTGEAYSYQLVAEDPDGDELTFALVTGPEEMVIDSSGGLIEWLPVSEGVFSAEAIVTDPAGASARQAFVVTVEPANQAPVVNVEALADAVLGVPWGFTVQASDPDGDQLAFAIESGPEGIQIASDIGLVHWIPNAVGAYTVEVSADDGKGGRATGTFQFAVIDPDQDQSLPAEPSTVAPQLDPHLVQPFIERIDFLYTGDEPIQTGVDPGAIDPELVAVVQGRILDRNGNPVPGVAISVHGRPEFGRTLSRSDGKFDLVVNGGGLLTLSYEKIGFLPVHRLVKTPRRDYVVSEDVVLSRLDPLGSVIVSSFPAYQVAQGSRVTDIDGTRQATLLFPPQTLAEMVMRDGSREVLDMITVRATEYTVGEQGDSAMPAPLPAYSGYTYAVELSADEAMLAGADGVELSQPIHLYLDNFLQFPVGEAVPAGWYDRNSAVWMPSSDGRIIQILAIEGGLAVVDVNGSGLPATASQLDSLGITVDELGQLATLYPAGKSLWRVSLTHFTPWDFNWPYGPPPDAEPPPNEDPEAEDDKDPEDPEECDGCVVAVETQSLGEDFALVGTPYSLYYRSDRFRGDTGLRITLSGASVPASLKRIELDISVAGQYVHREFPPSSNQVYPFFWDGRDAYGRVQQGWARAYVTVTYVYPAVYYSSYGEWAMSFALPSSGTGAEIGRRFGDTGAEYTVSRWWKKELRAPVLDPGAGLGGLGLDVHYRYDPDSHTLFGKGKVKRSYFEKLPGLSRALGGVSLSSVDAVNKPHSMSWGVGGHLYFVDTLLGDYGGETRGVIRRMRSDGVLETIVDGMSVPAFVDTPTSVGKDARGGRFAVTVPSPPSVLFDGLALTEDGGFFVTVRGKHQVFKVNVDGTATVVAGTGEQGSTGDGRPAVEALLDAPRRLALSSDGSLYVAEEERIRRIGPDGTISTVAGGGTSTGDGVPATQASLYHIKDLAFGPDGTLYFGVGGYSPRVWRLDTTGRLIAVAGSGERGYDGDGGLATEAKLQGVDAIAVGNEGSLYVSHFSYPDGGRVRRVLPGGIIGTVAGGGELGVEALLLGEVAITAKLGSLGGLTVDDSGDLLVGDWSGGQMLRIGASVPRFSEAGDLLVPDATGSFVYQFDSNGRHLSTLDAVSGFPAYVFGYDAKGSLARVSDRHGNTTWIERNAQGVPQAIVAPDGQRSELTLDTRGFIDSIANPAGEIHRMRYSERGQLVEYFDPRGNRWAYQYDDTGRLIQDQAPNGGGWTLGRSRQADGSTVALTSGEGRTSTFELTDTADGGYLRRVTTPAGRVRDLLKGKDGTETLSLADGSRLDLDYGPDPLFGMETPVIRQGRLSMPGGLSATFSQARTDAEERFTVSTTVNDRETLLAYEGTTRTWHLTTPEQRAFSMMLDTVGAVSRVNLPGLWDIVVEREGRGRVERLIQGVDTEARTVSLTYDSDGNVATVTDAGQRTHEFAYDAVGNVTRERLPDGRIVEFDYDENGNVTRIAPPGRPDHIFHFDGVDDLLDYEPPLLADVPAPATHYHYNLDRQLTRLVRPDGEAIEWYYDSAGRAETRTIPRGSFHYEYQMGGGYLSRITGPDGATLDYAYDGFLATGTSWAGGVTGSVTKAYNIDFEVERRCVNSGHCIDFLYDDDLLLSQAGDLMVARDGESGLVTGTELGAVTTASTYNGFAELETESVAVNGNTIAEWRYHRDALGRITRKAETIQGETHTFDYTYDAAGRLAEVSKDRTVLETYGYDTNGNRIYLNGTLVAEYDNQDRMLRYEGNQYRYTANGELLSNTEGGAATDYTYDVLGNLIQVRLPGDITIDYVIDGTNRRIGKKINGVLTQGFLYKDDLNPIAQLDGNNNVVSRFVYGDKDNVPAYMIKGGVTYRIISDHLGSPKLVIDTADGLIVQRMDYDVWGNVTQDTNPWFQPFVFAGGIYDFHTRLVRFGARDYDPETGRWTAKDPISFNGDDTNLYSYVFADPINFRDADGLRGFIPTVPGLPRPVQGTPGFRRELHEALKNANDPRPYWKKPVRQEYRCSCPLPPWPILPKPRPPSVCDRYYHADGQQGRVPRVMCSCEE